MPSITEIAAGPLGALVRGATAVIDKFVPDAQAKIDAQLELAKLQAEYQTKLVDADVEWAKAQATVLTAEIQSQSWLARNWRPITMLVFVYIIAHNYIIAQLFDLKTLPIVDDMWQLLKLGLGGYIIGRSVEKIAPDVAAIVAKKKE